MNQISIIIVDDHPLFQQGVVDALSLEPFINIVGLASDGLEGLNLIRDWQPSVAIVDVNLPKMNGQQLTRHIVTEKIPTRIVLLTAYDDREQQLHAMLVGASAYCTKDVQPGELVNIIRLVSEGKYVVGDRVFDNQGKNRWLERETESAMSPFDNLGESFQPLSTREMEVLTQVTSGLSNKEIAMSLGISHQTVKNHVTSIFRKLSVEDRTQATIYAFRRGWVRLYEQDNKALESD